MGSKGLGLVVTDSNLGSRTRTVSLTGTVVNSHYTSKENVI